MARMFKEHIRVCPFCKEKTKNNKLRICPECNEVYPIYGLIRPKKERLIEELLF